MDAVNQEPLIARRRRRWLSYSLRSMLVFTTLLAVVLGLWVNRAERQRRAVAAIREAGWEVQYDFEFPSAREPPRLSRWLGLDYVADVTRLDFFSWSQRTLTDAEAVHLGALTKLEHLGLSDTHISDAGLTHLSGLTKLKNLRLDGTQISDAGLARLSGLTNLESLSLHNTQISDAGLRHLGGLRNLKTLFLARTHVTDAGTARLRQALPNCQIILVVVGGR